LCAVRSPPGRQHIGNVLGVEAGQDRIDLERKNGLCQIIPPSALQTGRAANFAWLPHGKHRFDATLFVPPFYCLCDAVLGRRFLADAILSSKINHACVHVDIS
jgi:hypothetical protein